MAARGLHQALSGAGNVEAVIALAHHLNKID
jgi:hypothetical protein